MTKLFDLDQKDLKKLIKLAEKAPTIFRRASAGVLTDMAFATRLINKKQIRKTMTIRNSAFVSSALKVDKATTSKSISHQVATVGSIRKPRFSGWEEQETGKATHRERVASLAARGGSKGKTIRPSARLKSGKDFRKPHEFRGRNYGFKVRTMLNVFSSRKKLERFYMDRKYKGLSRGLYVIKRGKISKLQDADSSKLQPRRNRWMKHSLASLSRSFDVKHSWKKQLDRHLPKRL